LGHKNVAEKQCSALRVSIRYFLPENQVDCEEIRSEMLLLLLSLLLLLFLFLPFPRCKQQSKQRDRRQQRQHFARPTRQHEKQQRRKEAGESHPSFFIFVLFCFIFILILGIVFFGRICLFDRCFSSFCSSDDVCQISETLVCFFRIHLCFLYCFFGLFFLLYGAISCVASIGLQSTSPASQSSSFSLPTQSPPSFSFDCPSGLSSSYH
jgi:hypothetical protein